MKILNIRTIPGPNVYSHQPVLVMKLDLEDLAGRESYEIPGFVDRLLHRLPGCYEHYCGLGRRGGFVERLRGGRISGTSWSMSRSSSPMRSASRQTAARRL